MLRSHFETPRNGLHTGLIYQSANFLIFLKYCFKWRGERRRRRKTGHRHTKQTKNTHKINSHKETRTTFLKIHQSWIWFKTPFTHHTKASQQTLMDLLPQPIKRTRTILNHSQGRVQNHRIIE